MDIYCTRPHCDQPLNSFSDLDNSQLLKTVHQRHCSNCGMPLILDGRYLPIKLLQQGGLGVAFLGCDRRTPGLKRCVIKQLQINASFNTTQLEIATKLFHREAEVLEKLGEHPRIPRLFAFLELTASASPPYNQQKFFYLVQEYIEGQNLQEELRDKGKLSEAEVIVVLRETAKILEFIHFQDTIHRDVKPSNIMRDLQGKIHLIDFGAVKQVVSETLLKSAATHQNVTCVFTPEYAPAEQRQGQAIYPSSDLYALAVTCLNLLTGKQPQQLLDPSTNHWKWRTSDVHVSDALAAILDQMLENAPAARFQSARDVLDALEASWGGQTMSITPSKIQATSSITPTTMLAVAIDNNLPQVNQGSIAPAPVPVPDTAPDTALPNRNQSQPQTHPVAMNNNVTPLGMSSVRTSIESSRSSEIVIQRSTDNNKPWLIAGVFVTGVTGLIAMTIPPLWGHFHPAQVDPIASRSSTGEKILVSVEGNKDTDKFKELKRAGVTAISNHNYPEAVIKLQAALAENPNSPETRIYLNNALVGDNKSYTIAAVAPISSRSADRAAEMLRGFAQAQDEINQAGNVNDPKIKIKIIDDADDPKIVEKIATALVTQPEILGVVGHNRNDVTMKASVVYNAKKLSFIAPISTANQLTGSNKPYIFRTNAKGDLIAQKLVDQLVDKNLKKKVVIFYVPTISYNDEFKTQFTNKLLAKGGQVVGTFPFSRVSSSPSPTASPTTTTTSASPTTVFDADAHLQKAKAMGAEAILLLSVGRSNREALKILKIRATKYPELDAFSDTALYGVATLEAGKEADGLVMGVPWQESQSTPQFSTSARQLWNNQVNWATATSYNAVRALGAAIKNEEQPSRESVMKTLSKGEFMGASRKFQFTNGEPTDQYVLVKVSATPLNYKFSSRTGRDFVPLE
jgi:ABC-type branched-subunit amino acid transport system substrate-binding protein/serine/threonine protein kinase